MFVVDHILLLTGLLILFGIVSSKLSTRVGIPGLVLFLFIGMMAGSEGLGGIAFDNFEVAHAVGTLALAIILFDGGLQTSFSSVRRAWKPASLMATAGVLLTAALTAVAGVWFLGLSWPIAFLLGSIVSSTDAAAVFSILRKQGVRLEDRLASTLEIESGANDPMAVFLTIFFIELVQGEIALGPAVAMLFALQMGVGAVVGLLVGRLGAGIINRINLDSAGLYPVLAIALALTAFGLAAFFGGSGFLAVYLAGISIGNRRVIFQRGIFLFHDAAAWTSQIVMFTLLGLLSFPRQLIEITWEGIILALTLTLVARPLMVLLTMPWFGFKGRELTFLSWVGLKGAVPIVLALYPLMVGLPEGRVLFNIVFFVVLFSAITQGWSLPMVARKLGLQQPHVPEPRIHLELSALEHVDADLVEYFITAASPACQHEIRELPLPDEVHIALVARANHIVPSKGRTSILEADHVFVVHHRDCRLLMDRLFGGVRPETALIPNFVEFAFPAHTTADGLRIFYGIELSDEADLTLADLVTSNRDHPYKVGDFTRVGDWTVSIRAITDEHIELVGLSRTPRQLTRPS